MRPSIPALTLALTLALVSCAPKNGTSADLLSNPLFTEFYYDDLVEAMVNIELRDPDAVKADERLKAKLDDVRRNGLVKAKDANNRQDEGTSGRFVQAKEYAHGQALYLENILYFGPDFSVTPGPALHVYLSKDVDPRDIPDFPRKEDIDIGPLLTPYGTQQYTTPELDPVAYRTLVIYDQLLDRIYGFVQLAK